MVYKNGNTEYSSNISVFNDVQKFWVLGFGYNLGLYYFQTNYYKFADKSSIRGVG
jgi:hypothetical protein